MTNEEMQCSSSFLLGKVWATIRIILEADTSADYKLRQLAKLESEMRSDFVNLYYPNYPTPLS